MASEIATELPRVELELAAVADSCIKASMPLPTESGAKN